MSTFTYTVTREKLSAMAGRSLNDEEWEVMHSELTDLFDHYFNSEVPSLLDELDVYVAEYRELAGRDGQ